MFVVVYPVIAPLFPLSCQLLCSKPSLGCCAFLDVHLPDLSSVFQMESNSRIVFVNTGLGIILLQNNTIGGNRAKCTRDPSIIS